MKSNIFNIQKKKYYFLIPGIEKTLNTCKKTKIPYKFPSCLYLKIIKFKL